MGGYSDPATSEANSPYSSYSAPTAAEGASPVDAPYSSGSPSASATTSGSNNSDYWSNPANTPAGREAAARANTGLSSEYTSSSDPGRYASTAMYDASGQISGYAVNPSAGIGGAAGEQTRAIAAAQAASQSPVNVALMEASLPGANVYNQMAVALNAARQQGATGASVQAAVSYYNDPTDITGRAAYTYTSQLGNSVTQSRIAQGESPLYALNQQLQQAYLTPGVRDDRFFIGEIDKAKQNYIEASSGYHHWGQKTGLPVAPNPYEYTGDLALALEKGIGGKSGAQITTPTNLSVLELPNGLALHDVGWNLAMGKNYQVDFSQPISVIDRAATLGTMGVYGQLRSYSSTLGVISLQGQQDIAMRASKGTEWIEHPEMLARNPAQNMRALGYGIEYQNKPVSDRLVGGGKVAATSQILADRVGITPTSPMGVEVGMAEGSIPKPFVSGGKETTSLAPLTLEEMMRTNPAISGGLLGQLAFGEKAPEVIKGYVGSVVDFGTSIVGWTPFKDKMQTTEPELTAFQQTKESMESASPEEYNAFLQKSYQSGVLVIQPGSGTYIENPSLTNDYGEFSKWSKGAGTQVRESLGYTMPQLEQARYEIEKKQGVTSQDIVLSVATMGLSNVNNPRFETTREQLIFGAGYTISTEPGKIATAYGAGAAFVFGGEVVGGVAEASGITSTLAAYGAAHPTIAAVSSAAYYYGIPTVLAGVTYYGASEKLTASPGRTTTNIGGMIPEGVALVYGGASASAAIRGVDVGLFGFTTQERKPIYFLDDLPAIQKESIVIENIDFTKGGVMATPKPTEFLDLGQLFSGRKAGEYPTGVVEGLKQPELLQMPRTITEGGIPLRRVDNPITGGSKYEIDVSPVPMDMMPGVGKIGDLLQMESPRSTLLPGTERPSTFGLPKVESITPKGLETSFGGAPMGERMQATMINPTIQSATRGGGELSMDTLIQEGVVQSRVSPVINLAEQQTILPSKTKFVTDYSISQSKFEDIFNGIVESEKRPATKQLPSGMQMDYLRDALKQRSAIKFVEPQVEQQSPFVIQNQNPLQSVAPKIIQSYIPTQIPTIKQIPLTIQTPTPKQMPLTIQTPVSVQIPAIKQTPLVIQTPAQTQLPAQTFIPTSIQILTPIETMIITQTPKPATPYIPTYETPTSPVPEKPKTEKPYVPYTPEPKVPVPERPIPFIPIIPIPGIPWLPVGGGGGSGGGMRPRGPRHTEIFTYAPKNLKGLYGMPKGRTPAMKKRK